MKRIKITGYLALGLLSLLLASCAQYKGRTVRLMYVTNDDIANYNTSSRSFGDYVAFKDAKENETLNQLFTRIGEANGWTYEDFAKDEYKGLSFANPITWVNKSDFDQYRDDSDWKNDEGKWLIGHDDNLTDEGALKFAKLFYDMGAPTKTEDEKYEGSYQSRLSFRISVGSDASSDSDTVGYVRYWTDWNYGNQDLEFHKDMPFNRFTIGLDEKLGDCIALYPIYKGNYSPLTGLTGGFYVLDRDGNARSYPVISDEDDENGFTLPYLKNDKGEFVSRFVFDTGRWGGAEEPGDMSDELNHVIGVFGGVGGFKYSDGTKEKADYKLTYYPVYRSKDADGHLVEDPTDADAVYSEKDNRGYYYLRQDEYYVLKFNENDNKPSRVVSNATIKSAYEGLEKFFKDGYHLVKGDDGTPITLKAGDKFWLGDDVNDAPDGYRDGYLIKDRILVPKYDFPEADVTMEYSISPVDPSANGAGYGRDGFLASGTGDAAIDGQGFPAVIDQSANIRVRVGSTIGEVRNKLIERMREDIGALDDEDDAKDTKTVWWPMDVDPFSYLVESKKDESGYYSDGEYRVGLKIVDYDMLPNMAYPADSDESDYAVNGKHQVYRTYDFARELLYGYRDYSEHGRRYFFDLKRQGMARDARDSETIGGEWELKHIDGLYAADNESSWANDAGEKVKLSNGRVDGKGDKWARPTAGDDYLIIDKAIVMRPHYIDAGYAPIPRQVAYPWTDYDSGLAFDASVADPDGRRRLDIFANFIYIPGTNKSHPETGHGNYLADTRSNWGLIHMNGTTPYASIDRTTILPVVEGVSGKSIASFEAMEMPVTTALLLSLEAQGNPDFAVVKDGKSIKQNILSATGVSNFPEGDVVKSVSDGGDLRSFSLLNAMADQHLDFGDHALGNYSDSVAQGLGYRAAKQLCNLMTANYNAIYPSANLTPAYDENNGWRLVSGATGFRLPTLAESDYMNRIITQEQQFVPERSEAGVEVRKALKDRSFDMYYYESLASNELKEKVASAFSEKEGDYEFQHSFSLPGVNLRNYLNYERTGYSMFANSPYRSTYDVLAFRYQEKDLPSGSVTALPSGAKLSLNVRAGSGLMDCSSVVCLIDPSDDIFVRLFSTGYENAYKRLFTNSSFLNGYDYSSGAGDAYFNELISGYSNTIFDGRTSSRTMFPLNDPTYNIYAYDNATGVPQDLRIGTGAHTMFPPNYFDFKIRRDDLDKDNASSADFRMADVSGDDECGFYAVGRPVILDYRDYQNSTFRAVRTLGK